MVDKLGVWSTNMNMSRHDMNPATEKSTFQRLSQKHLDKIFDIYEEEYDLSYESRYEHMSSLKEWIWNDSYVLDKETFLLKPGPSEPFDDKGINLKSKVKESALINGKLEWHHFF
uniref:uncharacterized protein LOC122583864 n=1 Tax=Erigeron canadensis TaxID=72917 RepID=UPI001CB93B90|nr:uncharacterized protein LOC122583864 [Erigeron canadensis]